MAINRDEDRKFQELATALAVNERPRKTRIADSIDEGFDSLDMDPYFARQDDDEDNGDSRMYVRDYSRPGPGITTNIREIFHVPLADLGDGAVDTSLRLGVGTATFTRATEATCREQGFSAHDGTALSRADTAASVAHSLTGNFIDVRVKAAATDWTPSVSRVLVGKYGGAGAKNFQFYVAPTRLGMTFSLDGTAEIAVTSTVAPTVTDGAPLWVRFTRNATTGDVVFYTSPNATDWTQLGAPVVSTPGALFAAEARVLEIGRSGGSEWVGKIYRVQLRNDGRIVADYNPSEASASGVTSFTSGGLTWTVTGSPNVQIFKTGLKKVASGVARSHYAADGTYLGYLAEGARTNLAVASEIFGGASWSKVRSTTSDNATAAPDGTLTADKIVADATAASSHYVSQAITYTNAVHTASVFMKAGEKTWGFINLNDGTTNHSCYFNLATGAVGSASTATGVIEAWGNGWYRCTVITGAATAAAAGALEVYAADGNNDITFDGDSASGVYVWGAQLEAAAFPSTYIPTVGATATRNGDVLRYQYDNLTQEKGSAYAEVSLLPGRTTYTGVFIGAASNGYPIYGGTQATTAIGVSDGATGNATKSGLTDLTTGVRKRASSWGPNYKAITGDGAAVGSIAAYRGRMGTVPTHTLIGTSGSGDQPFGTIKNVRLWDGQLDDDRLQAITA